MRRTIPIRTLCLAASLLLIGSSCDDSGEGANEGANEDANEGAADSASDEPMNAQICLEEDRDDFGIGVEREGARFRVTIADALPSDPIRGDNGWTIEVTEGGEPVEGVTITIGSWMPDHGHGSPVQAESDALQGGQYALEPLNLFMAGLWEITLELETEDGDADEVMFSVCVE